MNGHPLKTAAPLSLCEGRGKQGVILAERKRRWVMSTLMKAPAASVCGVAVGTISTLLSPSVPWLRGSGGPPRPTRGTVTLEAIKDRQRHLANRGGRLAGWGRGGGGEMESQKLTEETEERAAHYRSERSITGELSADLWFPPAESRCEEWSGGWEISSRLRVFS